MSETLRPSSQRSKPEELPISSNVQVVSPDRQTGPIQLVWLRPVTEVVIDLAIETVENTRGKYTQPFVYPNQDTVGRRLSRACHRDEASKLSAD